MRASFPLALSRRTLLKNVSLLALLGASGQFDKARASERDSLLEGFAAPPDTTAPWVFWWWVGGNVSRAGITADLEAMARVGIGEAQIACVEPKNTPAGQIVPLSEAWWELAVHAVNEGARLGVGIGLFNCAGWSQSGGPWISPAQSMRYIVSAELRVQGPLRWAQRLEAPAPDFQQVSICAFPVPEGDGDSLDRAGARISATPPMAQAHNLLDADAASGCPFDAALVGTLPSFYDIPTPVENGPRQVIDITAESPYTARSLCVTPLPVPLYADIDVQCETDGGDLVSIKRFTLDRHNPMKNVGPMVFAPVTVSLPTITTRRFRLVLTNIAGAAGCGLAGVRFSAAARIEHFVEKQLGKMHQTTTPSWDNYHWTRSPEPDDAACVIDPQRIVDLSTHVDADGVLRWEAPAGEWIVLCSGMTPTNVMNVGAPRSATGLEVDKMNAAAVEAHFDAYVGQLLRRLPQNAARAQFRRLVADSYETGSQNWTDGFEHAFLERYGYDPRPWLPVLTGRLVGSADESDRFLWDLRRLIADRIATHYVGTLRRLGERHGLGLWLENYGHWGFAGEFLQYGGQSDRLAGEFWTFPATLGAVETDAAASAAAIYGKRIVSAESFTGADTFRNHPGSLKRRGDWAFARDINHFLLHLYIHQPSDEQRPGVNSVYGAEFNRHNTWFSQSRAWIDYLRRSGFLLQQGCPGADIAYFTGDVVPQMTGPRDPPPPPGYKAIFINAEAIEQRLTVRDGRFHLPGGSEFAVLVLPAIHAMRPEILAKLVALAKAGGTIVGDAPGHSPSLAHYPNADADVARLALQLWTSPDQALVFGRDQLVEALAAAGAAPALLHDGGDNVLWTHRRLDEGDLYFISNQEEAPRVIAVSLFAPLGRPEIWDAMTGAVAPAPFARDGKRVNLTLELPPAGAAFVLARAHRTDARAFMLTGTPGAVRLPLYPGAAGRAHQEDMRVITGPWRVHFPTLAEPDRMFDRLTSWSRHDDEAIRYFSGTALYRIDLTLGAENVSRRRRLLLDLGAVAVIAHVSVNGRSCGTVWTPPFVVDITDAARVGLNELNIEMSNLWYNRLLGLQRHPDGIAGLTDRPRVTVPPTLGPLQIDIKPNLGPEELKPSGLLGPVTLLRVRVE